MSQITKSQKINNLINNIEPNKLPISIKLKNATFWDIKDSIDNEDEKIVKLSVYGINIIKGIFNTKTQELVIDNINNNSIDILKQEILNLLLKVR